MDGTIGAGAKRREFWFSRNVQKNQNVRFPIPPHYFPLALLLANCIRSPKPVADKTFIVPVERVERLIFLLRGHKVMLDADLTELYGVSTKVLNQAVKRNKGRFPPDFMFQLNQKEFDILRSQFVTSSQWGGRRIPPYVFTEQGVAMLSSVLNSDQFKVIFDAIRQLMSPPEPKKRKIGFIVRDRAAKYRRSQINARQKTSSAEERRKIV